MSLAHWVWAQQVVGYGSDKLSDILNSFGDAEKFYNMATSGDLRSVRFSPKQIKRIREISLKEAEDIVDLCERSGVRIVTPEDNAFPIRLVNMPNPPFVLYEKGEELDFNHKPMVTMVGPRKGSDYGIRAAFSLSARLGCAGFILVSGGALGIDSAVHSGAIAGGGKTVAFLAAGHNSNYLSANKPLRDKILENGCLISEYPPNTEIFRDTFRIRNRLMSAISPGTVLIEAGLKSGALMTANYAAEQNRDIYVVPGNPSLDHYKGSNKLIYDGATPLLTADHLIDQYSLNYYESIDREKLATLSREKLRGMYHKYLETLGDGRIDVIRPKPQKSAAQAEKRELPDGISPAAAKVYAAFPNHPETADKLCELCGEKDVLSALTELELSGFVKALPGGRFELI